MKSYITRIGLLLLILSELLPSHGYAQGKPDTLKLPFAIADEKRLSDEDLKDKKEGSYVTGTPDFSSDPVNGFGYGGEGSIFLMERGPILFSITLLTGQRLILLRSIPPKIKENLASN